MGAPAALLGAYAAMSCATFVAYWRDKRKAARGAWRTPESTLHVLAVLGGWPGAWAAQRIVRHKIGKPAFLRVYWLTVLLNCAAAGGLLFTPGGQGVLHWLGR
jgi:uncharacterized membrane protein YsdA (DUF1294 family)